MTNVHFPFLIKKVFFKKNLLLSSSPSSSFSSFSASLNAALSMSLAFPPTHHSVDPDELGASSTASSSPKVTDSSNHVIGNICFRKAPSETKDFNGEVNHPEPLILWSRPPVGKLALGPGGSLAMPTTSSWLVKLQQVRAPCWRLPVHGERFCH